MYLRALPLAFLVAMGCSSPNPYGTADVHGGVTGISLESSQARSIVRTLPPNGEIMIATSALACLTVDTSEHMTIDLGGMGARNYTVVKGYPLRSSLSLGEARVHVCPAKMSSGPCDQQVLGGWVNVTRYDADAAGGVEGTFDVKFVDGEITGSFAAPRCD